MIKWEILILSQPSRKHFVSQLVPLLVKQSAGLDVAITVCQYDPKKLLGENREFHRRQCTAEYHNWIDDDDLVVPDYVPTIFPLLDGIDCIGYDVQVYTRNQISNLAVHSLRFSGWKNPPGWNKDKKIILQRNICHLNPMRTELALSVPMEGDRGEDERWAHAMNKLGVVRTERYIDRVMHYYLWRKPKLDNVDWRDPWRLQMLGLLDRGKELPTRKKSHTVA